MKLNKIDYHGLWIKLRCKSCIKNDDTLLIDMSYMEANSKLKYHKLWVKFLDSLSDEVYKDNKNATCAIQTMIEMEKDALVANYNNMKEGIKNE